MRLKEQLFMLQSGKWIPYGGIALPLALIHLNSHPLGTRAPYTGATQGPNCLVHVLTITSPGGPLRPGPKPACLLSPALLLPKRLKA